MKEDLSRFADDELQLELDQLDNSKSPQRYDALIQELQRRKLPTLKRSVEQVPGSTPARLLAFVIDYNLSGLLFMLILKALMRFPGMEWLFFGGGDGTRNRDLVGSLGLLMFLFTNSFYYYFTYNRIGSSFGKAILKLHVINLNSEPNINFWRVFLRESIVKIFSLFALGLPLLVKHSSRENRFFHDYLTDTKVVRKKVVQG